MPASLHFGADDKLVPQERLDVIQKGLSGVGQAEIKVYPGAEHGFSFPDRPSYNQNAAESSDRSVQALFASLKAAA